MTEIRFLITQEGFNEIPVLDFEALEEAQDGKRIRVKQLRRLISSFMVDEKENPVPFEEAIAITEKWNMGQLQEFARKFFALLQENQIPKMSGSPSRSLMPANPVGSPFPDGLAT